MKQESKWPYLLYIWFVTRIEIGIADSYCCCLVHLNAGIWINPNFQFYPWTKNLQKWIAFHLFLTHLLYFTLKIHIKGLEIGHHLWIGLSKDDKFFSICWLLRGWDGDILNDYGTWLWRVKETIILDNRLLSWGHQYKRSVLMLIRMNA